MVLTLIAVARRCTDRLARLLAVQLELHERRLLLERPWEEDLLHWVYDGGVDDGGVNDGGAGWHLHGHLAPPVRGPRRSVTSTGWCPGLERAAHRTGCGSIEQATDQSTDQSTHWTRRTGGSTTDGTR